MRRYRRLLVFLLSASALCPCGASVGTEGASFLDIPVGAGPAALGGAYAARARDVYGVVLRGDPAKFETLAVDGTATAARRSELDEGIST